MIITAIRCSLTSDRGKMSLLWNIKQLLYRFICFLEGKLLSYFTKQKSRRIFKSFSESVERFLVTKCIRWHFTAIWCHLLVMSYRRLLQLILFSLLEFKTRITWRLQRIHGIRRKEEKATRRNDLWKWTCVKQIDMAVAIFGGVPLGGSIGCLPDRICKHSVVKSAWMTVY